MGEATEPLKYSTWSAASLGVPAGEADANQGLGADPAAKLHELFQAGVARLQPAPTGRERHAFGRVADGGGPIEALGGAAAETNDARPQGLEGLGDVACASRRRVESA